MKDEKKDEKKEDKKKDEEEPFTVTWEHEDGSKDTTEAVKLVDKAEGGKAKEGEEKPRLNTFQRIKNRFFGNAQIDRAKLTALGGSALLSYGFVSNISYTTCLIAAWVIHARRTGFTPLDPGQWPKFLVVYGGFWMLQNILRPARFALSVALSPFFDRFVEFVKAKAGAVTNREINKPTAFGITVFIVNVLGSFSYLFLGLFLSTLIAGVPLLPASMRGVPGPV